MGKNIGNCALCKTRNIELRDSHLIPKLAYIRTKSKPKSRFRQLNNIKKPLQDGEKKPMLCNDCEGLFSKFETGFANNILDLFLKTGKIPKDKINELWFFDYCLSVNWRILYDDLYALNSFKYNEMCRPIFENFENEASSYFIRKLKGEYPSQPKCKHYIYKINDLVSEKNIIELFEKSLYGYCYYDSEYQIYLAYTYYLGLIIITTFEVDNFIYISSVKNLLKRRFFKDSIIKNILSKEIKEQAILTAKQYKQNMTNELREQINKYYEK